MATDPQMAFNRLANALEHFHNTVMEFQDADAPAVLRAADQLQDAYIVYDDVIFTQFDVEAPFDTYAEDDDEEDLADELEEDLEDEFDDDEYDFSDDDDDDELDTE